MTRFLIVLTLVLTLVGCSAKPDEVSVSAYKVLDTGAVVYDTVMKSAADLHDRGILTDADFEKVKDAAFVYFDAYRVAVDVLYGYMQLANDENAQRLAAALETLGGQLDALLKLAASFGVESPQALPETGDTAAPAGNSTEAVSSGPVRMYLAMRVAEGF